MKISKIEIFKNRVKLKSSFKISLGQLDYAENVLVRISTDIGISGFGECSPFKTINGESIDTCFIVAQYIGNALLNSNPLMIEACLEIMNKVIYGNSSIKSAFDIALYDIASQHAQKPLYEFLGGKKEKDIITDYTVSIDHPLKMAEDALKIKSEGFKIIKVKLGGNKETDIERIRLIREKVGNEIPLRIDANQGWDINTAVETLYALAQFNIQHCEEPIPRWDFMNLPLLRKKSPIPIMADESCCDHHDALRLIELNACDSLNVKLGKAAGIFNAIKIIALAEQANLPVQIGGFLESRLGFTASAHLALISNNIVHFDFDTPLMFQEDPISGGITYGPNGLVTIPSVPGLGAFVEENDLQKMPHVVIKV